MYHIDCKINQKMIKIISPRNYIYDGEIPETEYFDEEYTTDKRANELLEMANKIFENNHTPNKPWMKDPEIQIYYKNIPYSAKATFTLQNGKTIEYNSTSNDF